MARVVDEGKEESDEDGLLTEEETKAFGELMIARTVATVLFLPTFGVTLDKSHSYSSEH